MLWVQNPQPGASAIKSVRSRLTEVDLARRLEPIPLFHDPLNRRRVDEEVLFDQQSADHDREADDRQVGNGFELTLDHQRSCPVFGFRRSPRGSRAARRKFALATNRAKGSRAIAAIANIRVAGGPNVDARADILTVRAHRQGRLGSLHKTYNSEREHED